MFRPGCGIDGVHITAQLILLPLVLLCRAALPRLQHRLDGLRPLHGWVLCRFGPHSRCVIMPVDGNKIRRYDLVLSDREYLLGPPTTSLSARPPEPSSVIELESRRNPAPTQMIMPVFLLMNVSCFSLAGTMKLAREVRRAVLLSLLCTCGGSSVPSIVYRRSMGACFITPGSSGCFRLR